MANKIVFSSTFKIIVCSNEGEEKALKWTNENFVSPNKKHPWVSDFIFGQPRHCNCYPREAQNTHFVFGCFTNLRNGFLRSSRKRK